MDNRKTFYEKKMFLPEFFFFCKDQLNNFFYEQN